MRIALAGNPNSGKTTLFNALTGSTAHVGNWPGVTVDRREGLYRGLGRGAGAVGIVDLPGIYSLSPYTPEEVVARNYIVGGEADLIINIVDSTNIERNLYLTTQILEADIPVVVALNMSDVVRKSGDRIDAARLSERLGVPVVEISALRGDGIKGLMGVAAEAAGNARPGMSPLQASCMSEAFASAVGIFRDMRATHPVYRAARLLENDPMYAGDSASVDRIAALRAGVELPCGFEGDFDAAIADIRYKYIEDICRGVLTRPYASTPFSQSDRIDWVLTNRFAGIPIFLFFMFLIFHFTFSDTLIFSGLLFDGGIPSPGVMMQGWMEAFSGWVSEAAAFALDSLGASPWVSGLVVDGLVAGVGSVLSFLPQIAMLFLFLSILEDSGYMARAAFLMDRMLRRFGLSGRAFLPMLMGFGCSVPAIMGTRTLESERERRMTIMLMPFFSCGAKLPIWSVFSAALFPGHADLVVFGIYVIGIAAALVTAVILKSTILKGEASFLIMELPAYRMPQLRNLALHLWDKVRSFLTRATTIIAGATVVIWFLSNFDFSLNMVEPNSRGSIVGVLGSAIVPLFRPLGFVSMPEPWRAVVAIVTGLIAKEMVVSTLGVLYTPGIDGDPLESDEAMGALSLALVASFSPAAALSFMTFNLLSVPCMAAVAMARAELGSARWTWLTIAFWIATAWIGSFAVYRTALLFL